MYRSTAHALNLRKQALKSEFNMYFTMRPPSARVCNSKNESVLNIFIPNLWRVAVLWVIVVAAAMQIPISARAHDAGVPWKIMPFGDSITASSCYRAKLWTMLTERNLGSFQFVGTQSGGDCGVPGFTGGHEGHSCYVVTDILKPPGLGRLHGCARYGDTFVGDRRDLQSWFGNADPDIVLWHMGTNNCWVKNPPVFRILQAFSAILTAIRARNPKVIVLIAKILPMNVESANVNPLNDAIPKWAATNSTSASPIVVVDMFTGFDPRWTRDGVHPNNNEGSRWMANNWYQALVPIMKNH
jgi:acyl-CoA thioesterase-1